MLLLLLRLFGPQGVKSLASSLPEAKSLQHLILRSTGLLDEGAAALAAALQQPPTTPILTPTTSSSAAAAAATNPTSSSGGSSGGGSSNGSSGGGSNGGSSAASRHSLQVLDLSQNVICDTGAADIAAAVEAGVLPQLRQLEVVDNRYPFDWSTVLQLQGLQVQQPGLRVDLGAPSSWCVTPAAAKARLGKQQQRKQQAAVVAAAAAANPLPAGWTPADSCGSSIAETPPSPAAAAVAGSEGSADCTGGLVRSCSSLSAASASSVGSDDLCGVCFDAPNALYVDSCKHQLCIYCYKQLVKAAAVAAAASSSRRHQQQGAGDAAGCAACPFCRAPMTGFRYSAWVQVDEQQQGSGIKALGV
jgi:hypothetical protein